MSDKLDMPVAVAQLGARRHYLVPLALERAGLLDHFFTDSYLPKGWKRTFCQGLQGIHPSRSLQSFLDRHEPGIADPKVSALNWFSLMYKLKARQAVNQTELTRAWLWGGRRFCREINKIGLGRSKAVYAYTSAALELFERARSEGRTCFLDHATAPKVLEDRLVKCALERYPDWFLGVEEDACADEYYARQQAEWAVSDWIVCNSTFVQRLVQEGGGPVGRTVVVPLGMNLSGLSFDSAVKPPDGHPLRVFFAGDDALRKGLPDVIEACRQLRFAPGQLRIAGQPRLNRHGQQAVSGASTLIGKVPRSAMWAQYQWADVFVLPSISDTFALVVLEAMAAGLPVITTRNTGASDIIRDGIDGFVVPEHDPAAIAGKLQLLSDNRNLLRDMSEEARKRAMEFSVDAYMRRLVELMARGEITRT